MSESIVLYILQKAQQTAENRGLEVCSQETHIQDGLEMSGFIDIASDTSMGRITIWSTGECVLEAIDSNTENQKFYKNEQLKELNDLESLFNSFFNAIKDEVN